MRGGLKLEIDEIGFLFSTPGPRNGGGGFKAQARIPPGLRKDLPRGGVVLLFPRSSLRCFVVSSFRRSLCRGVVVLPMGCTAPPVDEEI